MQSSKSFMTTSSSSSSNPFEDVSQARNVAQEALWASTDADARKVFSYRESLLSPAVRNQMVKSIRDFYSIYWVVKMFSYGKLNISTEVARHTAEYAFPGTGKIASFHLPALALIASASKSAFASASASASATSFDDDGDATHVVGSASSTVAAGNLASDVNYAKVRPPQTSSPTFRICVRPRPMTAREKEGNNYHVVSSTSTKTIMLHVGKVGRSGNR